MVAAGLNGPTGGHVQGRRAVRLLAVAAVLSLLVPLGTAGAAPRPSAPVDVLSIVQSKDVSANSTFTIAMQVADASAISFVYFTFCQLTSPVCYLPVQMSAHASNWFNGTTKPMTSYPGMTPGTVAGYNITIQFTNGTNYTEPRLPNPFSALKVTTSVTGEYMYEMSVRTQVYTLSGLVTDAVTGAPVVGATVTLSPGSNTTLTGTSGGYAFTGLANGTYQISVTRAGYDAGSTSVQILNQNASKNVALTNATTSVGKGGTPKSSTGASSGTTVLYVGAAVAIVVIGIGAALVVRRRGGTS